MRKFRAVINLSSGVKLSRKAQGFNAFKNHRKGKRTPRKNKIIKVVPIQTKEVKVPDNSAVEEKSNYEGGKTASCDLLYEAKDLYKEALVSIGKALDIELNHVQGLISTVVVLRQLSDESLAVAKSFLIDALWLERINPSTWYNLGLLYKSEGRLVMEATECFEVVHLTDSLNCHVITRSLVDEMVMYRRRMPDNMLHLLTENIGEMKI